METFLGILIPFLGTTLGASCVFFMKRSGIGARRWACRRVMAAASIWSCWSPPLTVGGMGKLSFLPPFRLLAAAVFVLLDHRFLTFMWEAKHGRVRKEAGPTTMMGWLLPYIISRREWQSAWCMQAFFREIRRLLRQAHWRYPSALPFRIFPRVRSSPCRSGRRGERKGRAFLGGVLSGVVEPIGALLIASHGADLLVPAAAVARFL